MIKYNDKKVVIKNLMSKWIASSSRILGKLVDFLAREKEVRPTFEVSLLLHSKILDRVDSAAQIEQNK